MLNISIGSYMVDDLFRRVRVGVTSTDQTPTKNSTQQLEHHFNVPELTIERPSHQDEQIKSAENIPNLIPSINA